MKAKVLKKFRDKHTFEIHAVGEILNITKERYEEILTSGKFVEEVKEPKKARKKAE